MAENILIVDDEKSILTILSAVLIDEGYQVLTAAGGNDALKVIKRETPPIVLLDIWMADMDGIETLKRIKALFPGVIVIMMSGHGSIETAVKATKLGAYDYIEKPLSLEKVVLIVRHALREKKLEEENRALRSRIERRFELIGDSAALGRLKELIKTAGPTNSRVLISGENGTGKELVARRIHLYSPRAARPFIEVNCAAIPETLIESELFGHEKGAFTGAVEMKRGKFELADGGTLFLDEIGDMSLATQAKVLRVLQEQRFNRVGGSKTIQVDVRVIGASNKNLAEEIKKGTFREDLYYRLNVIPLHIPPLRERKDDIGLLVKNFLIELSEEQGLKEKSITDEAIEILKRYYWPGNVRELKNIIERLMIMVQGPVIKKEDILLFLEPSNAAGPAPPGYLYSSSLREARSLFEKEYIMQKLKDNGWNISKTAEDLRVERSHLHRKIKYLGIEIKAES
ncbi:MAG: sigma-54-dependent Fis family transcriptional regulator [Nitrospirae bacterium]|nr:sigma-54-dependent Fis family transcriptional regulator [Nitrospirota bacterium]